MTTEIIDMGWEKIQKELAEYEGAELVVGVIDSEIAFYAAFHEFGGTKKDFATRSFIRSTTEEKSGEIEAEIMKGYTSVLDGGFAESSITKVGLLVQGLINEKIDSGPGPALASSTVRKKGHGKPLYDSGDLSRSITFRIR